MNNVSNNVIKEIAKHWCFFQQLQCLAIYGIYVNYVDTLGVLPPLHPHTPPISKRGGGYPHRRKDINIYNNNNIYIITIRIRGLGCFD